MKRLISVLDTLLTIILIGALLVQTKRIAKWMFWPLFVFLHLLFSIFTTLAIAVFVNVFICQLVFGTHWDFFDSWTMYPLTGLTYLILLPCLYNAISLIEAKIDNNITVISLAGKLFGYIWGILINTLVFYRLW